MLGQPILSGYEAHGCRGRACPKSVIASVLPPLANHRHRARQLALYVAPSAPQGRNRTVILLLVNSSTELSKRASGLADHRLRTRAQHQHRLISKLLRDEEYDELLLASTLIHAAAAPLAHTPPGAGNARTCLRSSPPTNWELGERTRVKLVPGAQPKKLRKKQRRSRSPMLYPCETENGEECWLHVPAGQSQCRKERYLPTRCTPT